MNGIKDIKLLHPALLLAFSLLYGSEKWKLLGLDSNCIE